MSTTPEEVVAAFKTQLPAMNTGLGADREWLWWSGAKPDDESRKVLLAMGWRFTGKPHMLTDGRKAHWYHPCGGKVVIRRKGTHKNSTTTTTAGEREPVERINPTTSGLSDFMNFAAGLE